jgi:hypothetical protein
MIKLNVRNVVTIAVITAVTTVALGHLSAARAGRPV